MHLIVVTLLIGLAAFGNAESLKFPNRFSDSAIRRILADPTVKQTKLSIHRSSYEDLVERHQSARAQPGYFYDHQFSLTFLVNGNPSLYELGVESGVSKIFLFDVTFRSKSRNPTAPSYDPKKSDTSVPLNEPFSLKTGGCLAEGKTYIDTFYLGGRNPIFNHTFGSVTKFNFNAKYPFDGVFGLGWDTSVKKHIPGERSAPIINLLDYYEVEHQRYSLLLFDDGATIFWGQAVPGEEVPLHNVGGAPAFYIESVKFGKYEDHTKISAVVDSGYSTIALPTAMYRQVIKATNPREDPNTGLLVVNCGDNTPRPPKFVFSIGMDKFEVRQMHFIVDVGFNVFGKNLLQKDFPGEKCVLAVSQSVDGIIHLGIPFIQTVFMGFDIEENKITLQHRTPPQPPSMQKNN